jgi:hypothetical protein
MGSNSTVSWYVSHVLPARRGGQHPRSSIRYGRLISHPLLVVNNEMAAAVPCRNALRPLVRLAWAFTRPKFLTPPEFG